MKTTYTIYRADGTTEAGEVDWPESPGYQRISLLVTSLLPCDDIEHVTVCYKGKCADMFVDEIGHFKNLPLNVAASEIYRKAGLASGRPHNTPIAGTAVVFDRIVWR
jgi:hypothetical protein